MRARLLLILPLALLALVPLLLLSTSTAQAQEPSANITAFQTNNPGLDYFILADITAGSGNNVYARGRFGSQGTASADSDLFFDDTSPLILVRVYTRDGIDGGAIQINDGGDFIIRDWVAEGAVGLEHSIYLMTADDTDTTHQFPIEGNIRSSGGSFLSLDVPSATAQQAWAGISSGDSLVFAVARVAPDNVAPEFAETSYDRSVPENSLAGTNVGDPITATDSDDGDTLSYSLSGTGADQFAVDSAGQITVAAGVELNHELGPSYSLSLTATDDASSPASGTTAVNIAVTDLNESPAFAEPAYNRSIPETATGGTTLGAAITASDQDAGDTLSYSLSGTNSDSFTVDSSGQISVSSTGLVSGVASYSLTLTATDSGSLTATATVNITITDVNFRPSFAQASYSRAVNENSPPGTSLGTAIVATDPDPGDVLTYSLSGTGSTLFAVSSTGQITVASGAVLNHESRDSYRLTLTATDSAAPPLSGGTTVNITIRDVNERPSFADSAYARLVVESSAPGTNVGNPVTASDPDDGDNLRYSLSGTNSGRFSVSSSGQITVSSTGLASGVTSYSLTLTATDSGGLTATATVAIAVVDLNFRPAFPEASYDRDVDENSTGGTTLGDPIAATDPDAGDVLSYALSGAGSNLFSVDAAGQITVAAGAVLNHESRGSYSLSLTATDDATPPLSSATTVYITVNDLNERPAFASSSYTRSVNENSAARAGVGPVVGASDPDEGDVLSYSLSGTGSNLFTATRTTTGAQIRVATGATLDHERRASYSLTITGRDSAGLTRTATVSIAVNDVNESPNIPEDSYGRSLDENTPGGGALGAAIAASDPDDGEVLTYSLSGTGSGDFSVSSSGQVSVASGATIDHESRPVYDLTLTVRDSGGLSDTATLAITVNDLNEPPNFRLNTYGRTVSIRAQAGESVGNPVTATDQDVGDSVSYSLSGTDAGAFSVSGSGQITVSGSGLVSGVAAYTLTLTARDSGGLTDTARVNVSVNDDNNPPRIPLSLYTRTVDDGTPSGRTVGAPITATDPDGDSLEYRLSGQGNSNFSVNSSGQISTASTIRYGDGSRYNLTLTATDPYGRRATTNVRITVPPPPPSIGTVDVDVDADEAAVTVTIANPTGVHTVRVRYRVGASSWSALGPRSTGGEATFTITGLVRGQDYTVEASLDSAFAEARSATFHVPAPGAEPLRESVDLLVMSDAAGFTVDPASFTFFGTDYEVEELAQDGAEVRMVLRGLCPPSWMTESLTVGSTEITPSQSCTDTGELTLTAQARAGTLVDGAAMTLAVRSMHITDADPSAGMGHRRGSLRDTVCALPDNILGEAACIPIMMFVPPVVVVAVLVLVMGVTNPMGLAGAGLVTMTGMGALVMPGPVFIVGFILACLGVGAAFLLLRR